MNLVCLCKILLLAVETDSKCISFSGDIQRSHYCRFQSRNKSLEFCKINRLSSHCRKQCAKRRKCWLPVVNNCVYHLLLLASVINVIKRLIRTDVLPRQETYPREPDTALTQDIITMCFSRPWKPSTVDTSILFIPLEIIIQGNKTTTINSKVSGKHSPA